jgi:alkylation response protein AidB-like acyl-CoA dehydrogenase
VHELLGVGEARLHRGDERLVVAHVPDHLRGADLIGDGVQPLEAARCRGGIGELDGHGVGRGQDVTKLAAMAKLFGTDTAMTVTTNAVQILGGIAYTSRCPAERYMREAKVLQIFEGTNQIQRLIISRSLRTQHAERQ